MNAAAPIFGRPFDELKEGERFGSSGRTITDADLVAFSGLTGDWHPLHSDAVWAASSPFGERVAHGMLVLSYALGLVRFDPDRVVALRRIDAATFKAPVTIGDTISVQGAVHALRPLDDNTGLVELACHVDNQNGRLVARWVLAVLWRRSPT